MIALLLRFLITIPKEIYAESGDEYKVFSIEEEFEKLVEEVGKGKLGMEWWEKMTSNEKLTYMFNWNARKGWRFHSLIAFNDYLFLIFQC